MELPYPAYPSSNLFLISEHGEPVEYDPRVLELAQQFLHDAIQSELQTLLPDLFASAFDAGTGIAWLVHSEKGVFRAQILNLINLA